MIGLNPDDQDRTGDEITLAARPAYRRRDRGGGTDSLDCNPYPRPLYFLLPQFDTRRMGASERFA